MIAGAALSGMGAWGDVNDMIKDGVNDLALMRLFATLNAELTPINEDGWVWSSAEPRNRKWVSGSESVLKVDIPKIILSTHAKFAR